MKTQRKHSLPINPQLLRDPNWLLRSHNKVPHYTTGRKRSGTLDSPPDLARLANYDEACSALDQYEGWGLGFAINRGYQFIDLDDVVDATGKLVPWAKAVVAAAIKLGAFVEESISGTGRHITGYHPSGQPESFPTCKDKPAERYTHGRYMAMGRQVLHTGTDPLPDLTPLLKLLPAPDGKPARKKPDLRLVGAPAKTWTIERSKLPGLLAVLNPDMEYPDWRNVGMGIHDASNGSDEGLKFWDDWSQEGEKYKEGDCARYWAGFKPGGGITIGTLVHMARQAEAGDSLPVEPELPSTRRKRATHDEVMNTKHVSVPWPVTDLIPPGLTLLAAPPKMGKSYFVLQMGLCVASGMPFLGRETNRKKVVYFDLEEWEELLQKRCRRIVPAHRIVNPDISYVLELTGGLVTAMQDIQTEIDDGAKLIIIDLLARIRDEMAEDARKNAYARDYQTLRAFTDRLLQRHLDVAIVIVHHTNKGRHDDWQNRISGSNGLAGASHVNLLLDELDKRGLEDDAARKGTLKYRHLYVRGKAVDPSEMMLAMMDNGGGWELTDKTTTDIKMSSRHAHIMQVLKEANGAWRTAKEVHEYVDGTLPSLKRMMARMAKDGEIVSAGSGGAGYRSRG